MVEEIYFFDSYAIIEILKGNEHYRPYEHGIILTTKLNVFEVCYSLLRDFKEQEAQQFLEKYFPFIVDFDDDIIMEAAKFRLQHKKRNLSMADCIGYITARRWGVKFLTGDKEFEEIKENVEFVK